MPASASTSPALNIFAAKQNKEGNEHQQHIIVNCQDGFVRSDFILIPVTLFVSDLNGHFWCRNSNGKIKGKEIVVGNFLLEQDKTVKCNTHVKLNVNYWKII